MRKAYGKPPLYGVEALCQMTVNGGKRVNRVFFKLLFILLIEVCVLKQIRFDEKILEKVFGLVNSNFKYEKYGLKNA